MGLRKEAVKRGNRHPLWSKEVFQEDVEAGAESIRSICRKWSLDPTKTQAHWNDVIRWRKEDPALDALCNERFERSAQLKGRAGRPSLEKEEPDWRLQFCEEYFKTKSRVAASAATPYAYDTILRKLDPNRTEYDKAFSEMVTQTELRLLDRAEQIVHESLELEPSHRNRAWIALQLLRVRDRQRYGDKIDIQVGGTVRHALDVGKVIGEIASRQEKWIEEKHEQLKLEAENTIVVEVVPDE